LLDALDAVTEVGVKLSFRELHRTACVGFHVFGKLAIHGPTPEK
jgi:hypothetical protein